MLPDTALSMGWVSWTTRFRSIVTTSVGNVQLCLGCAHSFAYARGSQRLHANGQPIKGRQHVSRKLGLASCRCFQQPGPQGGHARAACQPRLGGLATEVYNPHLQI